MKNLAKIIVLAALILSICGPYFMAQDIKEPQTIAESSAYAATSRYPDVMSFIRIMQARSPYIRVETMGVSPEGREIPLVILGNPVPSSPLDLRTDGRAVVYIQGNIHAGEVEGKEADRCSLEHAAQVLGTLEEIPRLAGLGRIGHRVLSTR